MERLEPNSPKLYQLRLPESPVGARLLSHAALPVLASKAKTWVSASRTYTSPPATMGGAVKRELPSVPLPAEALHTCANGPSAMRLPMTLSAVPPGCGHSAFFLGGGKSILAAANCGSEASSPSVAMM